MIPYPRCCLIFLLPIIIIMILIMKILLHNVHKIIILRYPTYVYQFLIFLIITKIECWPVFKQDPNLKETIHYMGRELPIATVGLRLDTPNKMAAPSVGLNVGATWCNRKALSVTRSELQRKNFRVPVRNGLTMNLLNF